MSVDSEIFTALHERNSQFVDGVGKIVPPEIQGNPEKIAEFIGAPYQEEKPLFYKSTDGSFVRANIRPLNDNSSVFANLAGELGEYNLTITSGNTMKEGTIVTVCSQLPDEYNITIGKEDLVKSFIVVSQTKKDKIPLAHLGVVRAINGATLRMSSEDMTIGELVKNVKKMVKEYAHSFNHLYKTEIENRQLKTYFGKCLGVDIRDLGKTQTVKREKIKIISTKTENMLSAIAESDVGAPGAQEIKDTVWGALQAVAYYGTFLKTVRDTQGTGSQVARAASNLIGDAARLKIQAYQLAVEFATKAAKPKKVA